MTDNALGPVRRSLVTAARPGTPIARLKSSDKAVDPASGGSGLSGHHERDGHEPGDRPPPSPPAPPAARADEAPAAAPPPADAPHPLVYLAVDTVTGEVLWQVQGDAAAQEPPHAAEAYGPRGQLVYRQDADDVPHGLSKLV